MPIIREKGEESVYSTPRGGLDRYSRISNTEDGDVKPKKETDLATDLRHSFGNKQENRASFDFVGNPVTETDHLPYVSVYDDQKAWEKRGCFIPMYGLSAVITNVEPNQRGCFERLRFPYVYTIEVTHGPHEWIVKRKYDDFNHLATALKRGKAAGRIAAPFKRHVHKLSYSGPGLLIEPDNPPPVHRPRPPPPDQQPEIKDHDGTPDHQAESHHELESSGLLKNSNGKSDPSPQIIDKSHRRLLFRDALAEFPLVPDYCVKERDIEERKMKLQTFLSEVVKVRGYRDHPRMARFLGINHLSFVRDLGEKRKEEILVRTRSGYCTVASILNCCFLDYCINRKTFLCIKDSYVICMNPANGRIRDVILFDRDFDARHSRYPDSEENVEGHYFIVTNKRRFVGFKCRDAQTASTWILRIREAMAADRVSAWSDVQRFGSTYPIRHDVRAQWYVDGEDFMRCAADMIEMAKEDIFINSWCFHCQIFLKRRPWDDRSRMDLLLKRKAEQGVKIIILLWREIKQAIGGTSSWETKKYLEKLHPNIRVLRHPHVMIDFTPQWTNHEKLLIVDQKMALAAGIDFCYGRWDNAAHELVDVGKTITTNAPSADGQVVAKKTPEPIEPKGPLSKTPDPIDVKGRRWPGKDYIAILTKDVEKSEIPFEDIVDRCVTPRTPWHDMGCAVYGSAARDLGRHFIQRWNAAKVELEHDNPKYPFVVPKSYESVQIPEMFNHVSIPCNVQVVRSVGPWSASIHYTDDSAHQAYLQLIEEAEHFIYMENPFYVSKGTDPAVQNQVSDAMFRRIVRAYENKENFRIYIILPVVLGYVRDTATMRLELYYEYQAISRGEGSLLRRLEKAIGDWSPYIFFGSLRTYAELEGRLVTDMIYCHCKVLIADDRRVTVGSINIDDRSMMGFRDSEVNVVVEDVEFTESTLDGKPFKCGRFAGSLRRRLMKEHLGLLDESRIKAKTDIDVDDLLRADFWDMWRGRAKKNSQIYEKVFDCATSDDVKTLQQWKQRDESTTKMSDTNPEEARRHLRELEGYLVAFPTEFLSEATDILDIKEAHYPSALYT